MPANCASGTTVFPIPNSLGQNVTDSRGNTGACFTGFGKDGVTTAGAAIPDGIPDGFTNASRRYWAVEVEVNKSSLTIGSCEPTTESRVSLATTKVPCATITAKLTLESVRCLTSRQATSTLLGDQFRPGVLNTDRLHIINGFFTYVFDRGLMKSLALGTGVRVQRARRSTNWRPIRSI